LHFSGSPFPGVWVSRDHPCTAFKTKISLGNAPQACAMVVRRDRDPVKSFQYRGMFPPERRPKSIRTEQRNKVRFSRDFVSALEQVPIRTIIINY
jgi:hypothetical protein